MKQSKAYLAVTFVRSSACPFVFISAHLRIHILSFVSCTSYKFAHGETHGKCILSETEWIHSEAKCEFFNLPKYMVKENAAPERSVL